MTAIVHHLPEPVQPPGDRQTPASVEAEAALLGAILLWGRLDLVAELEPADLWRPEHGRLLAWLRELAAAGVPIEPIAVHERACRRGVADRLGGIRYLLELPDRACMSAQIPYYAARIRELSRWRALLTLGERLVEDAQAAAAEPEEARGRALADLAGTVEQLGASAPIAARAAFAARLARAWGLTPADLRAVPR